jgi:O-antigen/teichoic acid export membrane protein
VVAGLMQKFEMLDSAAIALLLRGGIGIGLFGVSFALRRSLPIALLVWLCAAGAVIASYDFSVARKLATSEGGIHWRFDWPTLRTLTITSLPLGFVSAIASLNTNIPRYTIERTLSVSDLGIFASVAYPVTAATITANSLGQSALARLSRLSVEGRIKEFKILVLKLVAIGAGLGAVAVTAVLTCGHWLLSTIYTPEYAKHESLFALLALTAGLNAIACFLSYGLTAARRFRVQLPITLVCTLSTFIFSVILVPRFKLMGAASALLISASVMIALAGTVLWRVLAKADTETCKEHCRTI